ncbi:hypothetical protein SAZ11_03580 [Streptomyces sp. FXJ1.4098]|nr:hypothetical protein [Streptomyces sp. FXJ1.4098]
MTTQGARQLPCESGEHGTIGPREPRALDLPTQHSGFMAESEDLDVVRGGRSAQQEEAAQ